MYILFNVYIIFSNATKVDSVSYYGFHLHISPYISTVVYGLSSLLPEIIKGKCIFCFVWGRCLFRLEVLFFLIVTAVKLYDLHEK